MNLSNAGDYLEIPDKLVNYLFRERRRILERMIAGEITDKEVFIGFTRGTPVVITDGPAGLSGSVKMVGFLPKTEYIKELTSLAIKIAEKRSKENDVSVMHKLLSHFYDESKMEFTKLGGLEMAFKHTWTNIKATGKATLVFFTPPIESYEIRCDVEIHEEGPIYEYLNALHDIFHVVKGSRSRFPAYVFKLREVYDQSASIEGFGKLIYKVT